MKNIEWNWVTRDGVKIYSCGWLPEGEIKAVVLLIHGIGEHVKRYRIIAPAFCERGYAMIGFDQRGHGESGGPRGHVPNLKTVFDDMDLFITQVEQRYPDQRKFIYGHSLGGTYTLAYVPERKPSITGAVVTGITIKNAIEEQKAKLMIARILGKVWPTFTLASGLDPSMLSRDQKVVQDYVEDPLVHDKMSTGCGLAALDAAALAMQTAPIFPVPVLVMHGSEDKLSYPSGSQEWAARAPQDKCTLKIWDGLLHEIHIEPGGHVVDFALDWLDKH